MTDREALIKRMLDAMALVALRFSWDDPEYMPEVARAALAVVEAEQGANGFDRTKEHSEHFGAPAESQSVAEAREAVWRSLDANEDAEIVDQYLDALIAAVRQETNNVYPLT